MGYRQVLKTQRGAGTAFSSFTTAKSVINPQALLTIPANSLMIGDVFEIDALLGISNIVTTPGLINFQIKMGPTANIVVFDTGNIQMNATAHTLLPAWVKIMLTLTTLGAGATAAQFMGQAWVDGVMFTRTAAQVDQVNIGSSLLAPATAPALGTAFDSTVANLFDFWSGLTISNAANTVQVQQYRVCFDSERN
jgi:hypothetical protein